LKFGHHPHPLGYLSVKFRFFRASIAQLAHGEISHNQSINHSPSLFDGLGAEAFATELSWPDWHMSDWLASLVMHGA